MSHAFGTLCPSLSGWGALRHIICIMCNVFALFGHPHCEGARPHIMKYYVQCLVFEGRFCSACAHPSGRCHTSRIRAKVQSPYGSNPCAWLARLRHRSAVTKERKRVLPSFVFHSAKCFTIFSNYIKYPRENPWVFLLILII